MKLELHFLKIEQSQNLKYLMLRQVYRCKPERIKAADHSFFFYFFPCCG